MGEMMKKFAVLLVAVLLGACSMKPSDELIAQQATTQLLQQYGDTIFEVSNFRKVNGISRDDNHYEAEVEYDLRFLVDLQDATERLQQKSGSIFAASLEATALGLTYGNFKAGDTIHNKEWLHFVRSEKGWLIDTATK
jgi:hypothetical protein